MLSDTPQKAKTVLEKSGSTDPAEIAKKYNILIWHRKLDDDIKGFAFVNKCSKLICLNDNLKKQSENFVIAHEIGHIAMHCKNKCVFMCRRASYNMTEFEADLFASYLTISDDAFKTHLYEGKSCHDIAVMYHTKQNTLRIRKALCHL